MKKIIILIAFFLPLLAWSQPRFITGKVTDAKDNAPLIAVAVSIKGSSTGVSTDIDGKYTIQAPGSDAVIVFSYIGYQTKEEVVGDRTIINLALEEDFVRMDELVITAVAIERPSRSLAYSVQTVKEEDLTRAGNTNILGGLQNKVAGVQITQASGDPGAQTNILIRGTASMLGNNQPLFVIDGIPIDNSARQINDSNHSGTQPPNRAIDINPDDIESLTVLKGPSAALLYGSRAANGAIIITTKSGKSAAKRGKKGEINFTSSYTTDNRLRFPKYQNYYAQGDLNTTTNEYVFDQTIPRGFGPPMDGRSYFDFYGQPRLLTPQPDNFKDFFETGQTFNNTVSLSGGNENANYYVSFGNMMQTGIIPETDFQRNTFKITGSTKVSDKITTTGSVSYVVSGGNRFAQNNNTFGRSVLSFFDFMGRSVPNDLLKNEANYLKADGTQNFFAVGFNNPYFELRQGINQDKVNRIIGFAQVGYDPFKWLNLTYRIGSDFAHEKIRIYSPPSIQRLASRSTLIFGSLTESRSTITETTSDFILTAKKDILPDLGVTFIAGHNVRSRNSDVLSTVGDSLIVPGFINPANFGIRFPTEQTTIQQRLWGVYGDLQFAYKNYLFLGFNARNDFSSTLPVDDNSYFYPGANMSLVFSEAFSGLRDKNWLTFGKLRASVAQVGNDPRPYVLSSIFENRAFAGGIPLPFNGANGYGLGNIIGNPDLQPEITTSWEVGLELGLLKDRISLDFTYYNAISSNQIFNVALPPSSGFGSKFINGGKIQNQGVEFLLNFTPVRKRNGLRWDFNINFTRNVNEVLEIDPSALSSGLNGLIIGVARAALLAEVGKPYGEIHGQILEKTTDGRQIILPNGRPSVTAAYFPIGNIQPDWLSGISSTISFKGLTLSGLLDIRMGGDVFSQTVIRLYSNGSGIETLYDDKGNFGRIDANGKALKFALDGVRNVGTPQNPEYVPNTVQLTHREYFRALGGFDGATLPADPFLYDATWFRLRELSLTYSLPKKWLERSPFSRIDVSFIGRNLWLHTPNIPNNHFDPDTSSFGAGNIQGFEQSGYTTRNFGASLRVTL